MNYNVNLLKPLVFVNWILKSSFWLKMITVFLHSKHPLINSSFIHSIGVCRMRQFLAVLKSFFHSSLLCTFSCHSSPPTVLPPSLTSSCYLFLGLPVSLVVPQSLSGILFSSILCTCPNQCNVFNLIFSIIVGFLTLS